MAKIASVLMCLLKLALVLIIVAASAVWVLLMIEVANRRNDYDHSMSLSLLDQPTNRPTEEWHEIAELGVPLALSLLSAAAVITGSAYWTQSIGLALSMLWWVNYQHFPNKLFASGDWLAKLGNVLHLSLALLLVVFGFFASRIDRNQRTFLQPSRVANSPVLPVHHRVPKRSKHSTVGE